MKIKLVSNWRSALKMMSVQAMTLGTALTSTYVMMYEQLKAHVDPKTMGMITIAVFVAGIAGRLIDQGLEDGDEADT